MNVKQAVQYLLSQPWGATVTKLEVRTGQQPEVEPVADYPKWQPREGLSVTDLARALEHIRRAANLHWFGGAFEPEHMQSIALAASCALSGDPIDAPVDMNDPEWRRKIREQNSAWNELCEEAVKDISKEENDD